MSESAALRAWRLRAQSADDRPRVSTTARVAAAAIAVGCALLGGRALTSDRTAPHRPPATAAPLSCPPVATALHADVDGDGCEDEVTFADGVLTAGPVRMRVGAPGDQLALGRWTCGPLTVAVLRPATGEVFRFDGWATPGKAVAATTIGRVEGAVGVQAAPRDGGPCDDVVVSRTSGPPVLLPDRPVAG